MKEPETYGGSDRDEGAPTCIMLDVASRGTGWYRISSTIWFKSSPFVCLRLMLGRFDSISSPFLFCFGNSVGDEGRFPIENDDEFVATDSADADCNPRGTAGIVGGSLLERFSTDCWRGRKPSAISFSSSTTINAPSIIAACTNTYCRRLWQRLMRCSRMSWTTFQTGSSNDDSIGGVWFSCSGLGSL